MFMAGFSGVTWIASPLIGWISGGVLGVSESKTSQETINAQIEKIKAEQIAVEFNDRFSFIQLLTPTA